MAVTNTPIFVQGSALSVATISTANTGRDGSGTIGTILTGGANGTIVEAISSLAIATTVAGVIRYWLSLDNGTTWFLLKEKLVTVIAPSVTLEVWGSLDEGLYVPKKPIILPNANGLIGASTEIAATFNVFTFGGNY